MNIVYVASGAGLPRLTAALRGRGGATRPLSARHLSTRHELQVCGAIVQPDSPLFQDHLPDWMVSADALDEFDVVYMEGGWTVDVVYLEGDWGTTMV